MKKILICCLLLFSLASCSFSNTPTGKVEKYLNEYNSLSDNVLQDIEIKAANETISKENKENYIKALKRQYQDLKYEIKDESIDGDKATVTVKITVYDFYKVNKNVNDYVQQNNERFLDANGQTKEDDLIAYKISELYDVKDTVNYEIVFNLNKVNNEWTLENPNSMMLEKINGLYNYEGY